LIITMTTPALRQFMWVEYFWSPIKGWFARSAEACDGAPDDGTADAEGEPEAPTESCIDPQTALWFELLEEARVDGKPDVVLHDRRLSDETVWQRKANAKRAAAELPADEADGFYPFDTF
jgi:hypothetical protein